MELLVVGTRITLDSLGLSYTSEVAPGALSFNGEWENVIRLASIHESQFSRELLDQLRSIRPDERRVVLNTATNLAAIKSKPCK